MYKKPSHLRENITFLSGNMKGTVLIILALSINVMSYSENCYKDETNNQQYCSAKSRTIEGMSGNLKSITLQDE